MEDTSTSLDGSQAPQLSVEHAKRLDAEDPLKNLRAEFVIPSKSDLKRKTIGSFPARLHLQDKS